MRNLNIRWLAVLAAFSLGIASHAGAAELQGEVVSVSADQDRFTIRTDDGQQIQIRTDDQTRLRSTQGQSTELSDLQQGDRVTVRTQDATGQGQGAERAAMEVEVTSRSAAMQGEAGSQQEESPQQTDRQGDAGQTEQRMAGRLPSTASPLPLLGLIGMLSLAAGLALRRRR